MGAWAGVARNSLFCEFRKLTPVRNSVALFALALSALALLGGCKRHDDASEAMATDVPRAVSSTAAVSGGAIEENKFGTPVKNRVATLGLLNKRNNLEQDVVLKSGEVRRVGNVVIKLASCERTLPWENPPEVGAFVQVFVEEHATASAPLAWRKAFSGWLFKNSPSVNVVEHPVYDVWVKDCAMKFPGEEEDLSAKPSKAEKAAGKASGHAKPGAKPATAAGGAPSPAAAAPPASPVPAPNT